MSDNMNFIDKEIPGVDIKKGIESSGSEMIYRELLGDVYKIIDEKSDLIESYLRDKDFKNYTTQVHSLKTTCRMMGAIELGEDFFTLEKLGREENLEEITRLTPDTLSAFRALKQHLEPFASKPAANKIAFDKAAVISELTKLIAAIDDFNLSEAEEIMKKLDSYTYDAGLSSQIEDLGNLVSNLDYDEAKEAAEKALGEI